MRNKRTLCPCDTKFVPSCVIPGNTNDSIWYLGHSVLPFFCLVNRDLIESIPLLRLDHNKVAIYKLSMNCWLWYLETFHFWQINCTPSWIIRMVINCIQGIAFWRHAWSGISQRSYISFHLDTRAFFPALATQRVKFHCVAGAREEIVRV